MLSILLIDDEPAANSRMRTLLSNYPEIKILGEAQSIVEAREFLKTTTPEVIFLDVELRGGSGLSLLNSLEPSTRVVFITAFQDYAVSAFDAGVVDYLVKPVDPERLKKTMDRVIGLTPLPWMEPLSGKADHSDDREVPSEEILHLRSRRYGKEEHLPIDSIIWLKAAQNYTEVQFCNNKAPITYRRRLNEWEGVLRSGNFQKLDRSLIIQYALLRSTEWINRDQTLLRFDGLDKPLEIGRTASVRLKEILNQESEGETI